ncbi:MAG: carotenoid 1,2-hydratase [Pseudomonadota bacterium]
MLNSADTLPGHSRALVSDYFDTEVTEFGYRWWYADVVSDDGAIGLVIIGFIGSVFSPYYASSRRRGNGDPRAHCAMNAIVYEPQRKSWAMTERSESSLEPLQHGVRIGPSQMQWQDRELVISINERCNPLPRRWQGEIRITPQITQPRAFELHSNGNHWWWPAVPIAHARVALQSPSLAFSGSAYVDTNYGHAPLERDFVGWNWTRREMHHAELASLPASEPLLTYATRQRDGGTRTLSLGWSDESDGLCIAPTPARQRLPHGGWRVARETLLDGGAPQVRTLEDTPFYVRSLLQREQQRWMHESLDLDRFASRWVQCLLPFRMPRRDSQRR